MRFYLSSRARLGVTLLCSSMVSLSLYVAAALANGEMIFTYLPWNLCLAWLPLLLALWLERILRTKLWSSWLALLITIAWLSFLPNSFYMITDFIHLNGVPRVDPLFDVTMFTAFVLNGIVLGCVSVYLIHTELLKRLSQKLSTLLIGAVLLLASFAVYIGRDLRWNSWDVLFNPASVVFDVSDRILNPGAHPQLFSTTISFFLLLSSVYGLMWMLARASRAVKQR